MVKKYKPLTPGERRAFKALIMYGNKVIAYREAYAQRCKNKTNVEVRKLAVKLFDCARGYHFKDYYEKRYNVKVGEFHKLSESEREEVINNMNVVRTRPGMLGRRAVKIDAPTVTNVGRPDKYKPEYPRMLIEYFSTPQYMQERVENKKTGEVEYVDTKFMKLPTKAGFACSIMVAKQTVHRWATLTDKDGNLVYPEFSEAYKLADQFQEEILAQNTLAGKYNSPFAIFAAKNLLGWRDTKELDVTARQAKAPKPIDTEMSPEQAALIYRQTMLGEDDDENDF